jgi:hypothetical protein
VLTLTDLTCIKCGVTTTYGDVWTVNQDIPCNIGRKHEFVEEDNKELRDEIQRLVKEYNETRRKKVDCSTREEGVILSAKERGIRERIDYIITKYNG